MEPRFWAKVNKTDGCWLWTAGLTSTGYGKFRVSPTHHGAALAHRVSWFIKHGRWPHDGLYVCHHCDVPACVNPDHLFLGTQADNQQDASRKGRCLAQANPERMAKGERNGNSRITREDVLLIREKHSSGLSMAQIARDIECGASTVRNVIVGRTWKWL
jgi:hypothetical protein